MTSTRPRTQFSDLPYELRSKVWEETFVPRILELHSHQTFADVQGPVTEAQSRMIMSPHSFFARETQLVSTYFTATLFDPDHASYHSDWAHGSCRELGPPPPPVALEVCHESRALALRRYKPFFGGTKKWMSPSSLAHMDERGQEWHRCRWEEKRTWVDFSQDTLVVECLTANDGFWNRLDHAPLWLLAHFAKLEAQLVKRVIVGAFWTEARKNPGASIQRLRYHYQARPAPSFATRISNSEIWQLEGLEELVVYVPWREMDERTFETPWNKDEAREILVGILEEDRDRRSDLVWKFPDFRIVEDLKDL